MLVQKRPTRQSYNKRLGKLRSEYTSSYQAHHRELAEYILPRTARFLVTDARAANAGSKKNDKIINASATRALHVASAGMMSGITSPSRPWKRLITTDPDLMESAAVRDYLDKVNLRMDTRFHRSNLYRAFPEVYEALLGYGVSPMFVERDAMDGMRCYVFPIGSYYLANSARLQVDTLYRMTTLSVAQIMEKFAGDEDRMKRDGTGPSKQTRGLYDRGDYDEMIHVCQVIEPNREHDPDKMGYENMHTRGVWFEVGAGNSGDNDLLGIEGFSEFPVMAPRWSTTGEDVYGSCPAMDALGDIKALQLMEKRKAQALDRVVHPALNAPSAMMTAGGASTLPGAINYIPDMTAANRVEATVMIPPQIMALRDEIQATEQRIAATFYSDLWMSLTNAGVSGMTAREVAERHEEKMLQLGPVLERLQDELLDPLVDRAFTMMERDGDLPEPPPPELEGRDLRVEYISILAQAQKLVGTNSMDRLADRALSIAPVKPDIMDKIDWDEYIDSYGDALGTPSKVVKSDDDVAQIRTDRLKAEQAQQMLAAAGPMKDMATAAKGFSDAVPTEDNVLGKLGAAAGQVAGQ